ncbi:fimbrial protein [Pseudomonas sp. ADAK13]|jgi:minor fimbrial subunit|uniref:fimbrial protein n=1 Tax=unclassified Pseudomonas TaxID=196821 RepID=UPI0002896461|nr:MULTISPECIES: fimbrial protein [unclassified Pseudomonas]QJI37844.1 fimbrial protein [Pseudomonas sp. ADAK13]
MNGIKAALLAGLLLTAGIMNADAADVTITVNGRVVAHPCTVSTPPAAVVLGDLYASDFSQAGASSAWYPVTLGLTDCPVGTSRVTATFTGTADNTGYYQNQGNALNLQLELQDTSGKNLNNGNSTSVQVNESTQSASVSLQVRALSVNGNATQGSIQALINVTYTYS